MTAFMKTLLRLLAIAAIIAQTPIHAAPILWSSASGGNDHYYDITPDRMNWDAAESFAVSRGGHLVSIQSGAEQAFLASTFLSSTDDHRIAWIGINDVASEGSFIWSSGEPVTYNNWNVSEPNNFGDEDYGVINWNYGNNHPGATPATWNDVHVNGTTTPQNPNQALPYFGIYEYSVGVSITSHPQPLTLNTGETATFTVAATGSGALTYQWQKDGADMPGKTSPTLTLSNVQPQNVGYYLCKVSSLSGAVPSKQVTLSINGVDFGVWQGLVAYYQFNGNAIDSTGHGFDGVPAGAVSAIDRNGAAGAAYRLNGSSFVDFPQFPTLGDRGAQFTISLWVKAESTGPIFGDYEGSMTEEDSTFAVQIGVDSNSAESPLPNFLSITSGLYYEVSSDFTHFIGNSPMVGSGWRHIVYQMDGVGSCRTFVDGTRVGSRPYLANRSYVEAPRWRAGNILAAGQQQYFTGSLDDIRIYNRALSDTEVLQLYSSEGGQGFGPVSQTWVQRYDGPDALNDYGVAVAVDSSSNVVVTGISHSIGGLDDIFTAKYAAANGALIWLRRYNGPASGNDRGHCIAVDSFGDVIVCGTSADFGGTEDFYTAKYAALDGSLIWEKRYDGPPSGADIVNAVVLDPDGNVIVTGKSFNGANFDFTTVKYALLDGAVLWEQRYDGPAHGDDIANAVAVDGQGDVVVAGQSASEGGDLDFCTVKYRGSDGMLIWDHRKNRIDPHFGGVMNAEDILRAVAITPSGDVVVTGSSGRYPWTTDYYIAEYSGSDGELIWDSFRNFIGGGIGEDGGTSVVIDPQGNIVATGYATTNTSSAASYYIIKYQDQTGHAFWEDTDAKTHPRTIIKVRPPKNPPFARRIIRGRCVIFPVFDVRLPI